MTFAVLPFEAPTDDNTAARIAVATAEAVFVEVERQPLFAQVASRRSVEQTLGRHSVAKEAASVLNVNFLIRGNVAREGPGYKVDLLLVDMATHRVIDTRSLAVPAGALGPVRDSDYRRATGWLIFRAVQTEVERARNKPMEALDVRDLVLRAYVDWLARKQARDEKGAYVTASDLLNRALALAPDDPLALQLAATVNLCDCVEAWSSNVEEQLAIGEAALEKYLRHDPLSPEMLLMRSRLFVLRGRYEESLLIADSVLKGDPENSNAAGLKAYNLLKLGRAHEALAAANAIENRELSWRHSSLAAAIHYELGQYEPAAQNARRAITRMDREELANRRAGAVGLTLVAAEARLGQVARAKSAMNEFNAVVPGVQTISAIRKWMHPAAELAGNESLVDGLKLAGVGD